VTSYLDHMIQRKRRQDQIADRLILRESSRFGGIRNVCPLEADFPNGKGRKAFRLESSFPRETFSSGSAGRGQLGRAAVAGARGATGFCGRSCRRNPPPTLRRKVSALFTVLFTGLEKVPFRVIGVHEKRKRIGKSGSGFGL
jgi:hypothetical protein